MFWTPIPKDDISDAQYQKASRVIGLCFSSQHHCTTSCFKTKIKNDNSITLSNNKARESNSPFTMLLLLLLLSHFSSVRLCAIPQMEAHQAALSLGFSRQEHWSGSPFPSPGDLPHPAIEPESPSLQVDSFPAEPPGKLYYGYMGIIYYTVLSILLCA